MLKGRPEYKRGVNYPSIAAIWHFACRINFSLEEIQRLIGNEAGVLHKAVVLFIVAHAQLPEIKIIAETCTSVGTNAESTNASLAFRSESRRQDEVHEV